MQRKLIIGILLATVINISFADNPPPRKESFRTWVKALRVEALADGIKPQVFDSLFKHLKPDPRLLHFDRKQPEKRLTFRKYRKTRGDNYRILLGKRYYKKYRALLEEVGGSYGVSPCMITALWGIESSYGNFMGTHKVIRSLATLAYDTRRSDFFRNELIHALRIVNGGHVKLADFKGEWAGGTGQPQFLPSSWFKHAVDYDKDGRKDIWRSHADIFASIANYLVDYGWKSDEPWGVEVRLPRHFDKSLADLQIEKSVSEWEALGIKVAAKEKHPDSKLMASIVTPLGGPNFMVFNNFKVLMEYNRSTYYAATVAYISDSICKKVGRK